MLFIDTMSCALPSPPLTGIYNGISTCGVGCGLNGRGVGVRTLRWCGSSSLRCSSSSCSSSTCGGTERKACGGWLPATPTNFGNGAPGALKGRPAWKNKGNCCWRSPPVAVAHMACSTNAKAAAHNTGAIFMFCGHKRKNDSLSKMRLR